MSTESIRSHLDHPLYTEALYQFQRGRWEMGLASLDRLIEEYPLVHELRTFRNEMLWRANIDQQEVREQVTDRRKSVRTLAFRLLALLAFTLVVFVGIRGTSLWAEQQWVFANERLNEELADLELSVKFRNAQDLLEADRVGEALVLFSEVKASDPEFQDLDVYIAAAEELSVLDQKYAEGMQQVNSGNLTGGLFILEEVAVQNPFFKDVSIQIDNLKKEFLLDDLLQQAELAYQDGNWEEAVYGYENIRTIDPEFRKAIIEENLFESYMSAADLILAAEESLEALERAETYYRKALSLRPQSEEIIARRSQARVGIEERLVASYLARAESVISDQEDSLEALGMAEVYLREALVYRPDNPEILLQLRLAKLFMGAQSDFNRGLWDQVINDLEIIYNTEPNYARGTARQTLYDAYIARGKSYMAGGDYETALSDFQRAAILADQQPEALLRLFEAQVKIAEVQGILGNYENATLMYRDTLDLGGVRDRANQEDPALTATLDEADRYMDAGNYPQAYRLYRFAVRNAEGSYDTINHVVQKGEYLTLIAALHGSTVQAIVSANDIVDPNRIYTGQELIIPILPYLGE